jgi:hypothetical protein
MQRRRVNDQTEQTNEIKEDTEAFDFAKPDYIFSPKGFHQYRQQGSYLVCKSCEIQHATWIGIDKIMVGMDEKGQPIIKKRSDVM